MAGIIWIASYPKSGNTWMRAFITNLLRDPEQPHDINRLTDVTAAENSAEWYHSLDPRPASTYTLAEVQRMRRVVQARLASLSPHPIFLKTHNALLRDRNGPLIDPAATAAALYMVRNPLDVAVSYARYTGDPIDHIIDFMSSPGAYTENTDATVYEFYSSWSRHVASWTGQPGLKLCTLRYEDMLADPARSFGKVAEFLGIPANSARLAKAIEFSSFAALQRQETSAGFVERPPNANRFFREGKSGQWRNVLSPAQVARIVEAHRDAMARFGYLPSPSPPR